MIHTRMKRLITLTLTGVAVATAGCMKEDGAAAAATASQGTPQKVALQVTANGYEPSPLRLRKGVPVELTVTRTTDATCATELILEEQGLHAKLPLNEAVTVRFTPTKSGELRYGCAMDKMISGVFKVE